MTGVYFLVVQLNLHFKFVFFFQNGESLMFTHFCFLHHNNQVSNFIIPLCLACVLMMPIVICEITLFLWSHKSVVYCSLCCEMVLFIF